MEHKILKRYPIGNPRRAWKQDNFILSNFSAKAADMRKTMRHCKEAGFNMVEIGWASHEQAEEAIHLCEQIGLNLIFQDLSRYGGMQDIRKNESDDALLPIIRENRPYKRTVGYYIWDEPFHDDEIERARVLTDLCEKEAPDLLPFTVAIPSYNPTYTWENGRFPEYLEKYVTTIDPPQLSLDYYPIALNGQTDKEQLDNTLMWCDLGLMKHFGEKYDMPIWFYYQGQNLNKAKNFTFPMIRAMMYAGVLYGAKGLQHYTAVGSIITKEGDKDIFFEPQKQIHREFEALGETLMAISCKRVIHDESLDTGCEAFAALHNTLEESAYFYQKLPKRVSVAEYEDAYENGYVLILNRDYQNEKEITLPFQRPLHIYEVSKEDGLQHLAKERAEEISLTLAPGDAALYRLQDAKEDTFTIEYRLYK